MFPRLSVLVLSLVMVALPMTVSAANMRFLQFSPSAYFTDQDWDLLKDTVQKLLDNHKVGESLTWKNDKSGNHGKLTLLGTFSDFGTTCHQVEVRSITAEVSATRVVSMCKNKEGEWKILN